MTFLGAAHHLWTFEQVLHLCLAHSTDSLWMGVGSKEYAFHKLSQAAISHLGELQRK